MRLLCDRLPVGHPCLAETRPAPHPLAPHLVCFLNTSVGKQRTEPAGTKAVCSTLSWQLSKQLVSDRTKGQERRTSLGRERLPGTHLFLPLGPSHQGPGVLTKTHAALDAGFGDCVGLTHPHGSGSCTQTPRVCSSLLCVLPLGDSQHLNWRCCPDSPVVLSLLFILGHSHEVRHLWMGCCSVFCWVKTFGGHIPNLLGHHCLRSPRWIFSNLIFIFYWIQVDFHCFVSFSSTGT